MGFKARECPKCGGSIEYVSGTWTCLFCGTPFDPIPENKHEEAKPDPTDTPTPSPAQNAVSSPEPANEKHSPLTAIVAIVIGLIVCTFVYSWFCNGRDSWNLSDLAGYTTTTSAENTTVASSASRKKGGDMDESSGPTRVFLTNLDPYTYSSGGFPFFDIYSGEEDIFANRYQCGFRGHKSPSDGESYAIWRLDGLYETLEFTLAIADSDRGNAGSGAIYIYGDGVLLFSRDNITCETKTERISLDVTGCCDLTIELYGSTIPCAGVTGWISLWPMAADLILYKDVERGL